MTTIEISQPVVVFPAIVNRGHGERFTYWADAQAGVILPQNRNAEGAVVEQAYNREPEGYWLPAGRYNITAGGLVIGVTGPFQKADADSVKAAAAPLLEEWLACEEATEIPGRAAERLRGALARCKSVQS